MAEKQKFTTALSQWNTTVTNLITEDFKAVGVPFDDYSKTCALSAMTGIYQLITGTEKESLNSLDISNLREVVGQAASLKLNANSVPAECFFQLRNKKRNDKWVKVVELGVQGNGYDALLRNFGVDVRQVYPVWLVKEGDEFQYPKRKGLKMEPPEWTEMGKSSKVIRVVYPILLNDGSEQYLIAERDSVKTNLFAHIRQNMLNETFGLAEKISKATDAQKMKIKEKKEEILDKLRACETVDDMLKVPEAKPYISPAWLDTPESMIVRKMRNNAIRTFPKDLNAMAKKSMLEIDEVYKAHKEEEEENANQQDFDASGTEIVDAVDAEIIEDIADGESESVVEIE